MAIYTILLVTLAFIVHAGMYIENEDGKLVPLKADHDVLNLKESQVVVVEIKD